MAGAHVVVIQGWVAWVALAAIVVAAVVAVLLALLVRRRREARGVPVAHAERLTALPGYRRAMARYRGWLAGLVVVALIGIIASTALVARVARVEAQSSDLANRDIVLCLDVSGSMVDYDSKVVDVFAELAKRFQGERLSLVVFNASAVTYFPLTSDLGYIEDQFRTLQQQFASPDQSYFDGTLVGDGSSLVGDGLASCVLRFDQLAQARSRSIVLVTDNVVIGKPVFTLTEAGQLAKSRGVRVYGINPGDQTSKDYLKATADEFRSAVSATGGGYYTLGDPQAIPSIVSQITAQQASVTKGPTRVELIDTPEVATLAAALALLALIALAWRVRR